MNSQKKSLFDRATGAEIRTDAGAKPKTGAYRAEASGPRAGCLMATFLQQTESIEVERRVEMRKKKEGFHFLLNGLAEPLAELLEL